MSRYRWCDEVLVVILALFASLQAKTWAVAPWSPPSSLQSLPVVQELPDLFTFADGREVATVEDWKRRREELKAILLYYQYGSMPPRPDRVVVVESRRRPHESGLGTLEYLTLEIDSVRKLPLRAVFYLPKQPGRRPVIIREEDRIGHRQDVPMFLERGYIFIEYARHDIDPDRDRVVGAAQAAYPDQDWATLSVWAWCGMRLVDYLETRDDVDLGRIGITGHSRGGKMALLTAALDDRISLVVPHQSGSGGAGSYRVLGPGAETLAHNDKPHWYHERLCWFREQEERLPFDQHFLKALVAPRALLCTESIDDEFANPLGSLVTSVAAQPVFEFLGATDRNGIHFRRGGHSTRAEDWARVLEFAEWHFFGRAPADPTKYWRATFPLPRGYDTGGRDRPLIPSLLALHPVRRLVDPAVGPGEPVFHPVGLPGNPADRDYHGQGRFGAVDRSYRIAEHQVTHVEYARFLNAVAAADPAGLYHPAMAGGPGAIHRISTNDGYHYQVRVGEAPRPITYVSWYDAIRYCNWLHHGRPTGPQGPATTEEGAYTLTDRFQAGPRQADARCFLPTEDEWYKAAYYTPLQEEVGSYRHFEPSDTSRPLIEQPLPDLVSPWGMAGFADGTWDWTESRVGRLHCAIRSGAWYLGNNKQSAGHFYSNPVTELPSIGIRVVMPAKE